MSALPSGPGVIDDLRIAEIAAAVPRSTDTFLLTAHTRAEAIATQHAAAGTTTLQLVDQVPVAELRRLRLLQPGVKLVQVIHVMGDASVDGARAVAPYVDALLLDSGNSALAIKQLGGTGRTHDWALSRRIRDAVWPLPLFLAGGLQAGNVGAAISTFQPQGLDLCGGALADGRLDDGKPRAFAQAVAAAAR